MKAHCPQLAARPMQAPTPNTLQITDGCQGRDEAPRARCCSFQMTDEEAIATLDVVAGMYSFMFMYDYFKSYL